MLRRQSEQDREALRAEFLRRASAEFDRMFGPQEQPGLVTWEQRENRAEEIGGNLAQWALERHVGTDEKAEAGPRAVGCPQCGKPAVAVDSKGDGPPVREVQARAGRVPMRRKQYHCAGCRKLFFPSGP
ncbi:MAG: hypothetical protein ACREKK_14450 [Candidatus Methylomirabilales bacterium]